MAPGQSPDVVNDTAGTYVLTFPSPLLMRLVSATVTPALQFGGAPLAPTAIVDAAGKEVTVEITTGSGAHVNAPFNIEVIAVPGSDAEPQPK